MYSIRRRLTLGLAAGFAALLAATATYVEGSLSDVLVVEFDTTLRAKADALAALTDEEAGVVELDYTPGAMPEFERADQPEYFQFWIDDGTVVYRSARLATPPGDLPRVATGGPGPVFADVVLPDGRPGRAVQMAFDPKPSRDALDPAEDAAAAAAAPVPGLVLVVARGRGHLDQQLESIRLAVYGAGALAGALGMLLVWWVLAAGFAPIDALAARVGEVDVDDLTARVRLRVAPRELAPIADQLDALLDRLEASFLRERRFAGNVAHELRTPIAELRSLAAVGQKWPEDELAVVRFFRDVGEIADRMERVITDLLLLARCQAGVEPTARAPVRVRDVVAGLWAELADAAAARGLRASIDVAAELVVDTDPGKLAILVGNLLRNAVSYATPGTEIRCTARLSGSAFSLAVENAAARLSPGDLERLAEPFWRADEARSSDEHAGLGLSLVCALAPLLGLAVRFDQDQNGVFQARVDGPARRVELPRSEPLRSTGSS